MGGVEAIGEIDLVKAYLWSDPHLDNVLQLGHISFVICCCKTRDAHKAGGSVMSLLCFIEARLELSNEHLQLVR